MLKSNDRTLVFYQADGLIYPGHKNVFSEDNISSLVGMKIKIAETGCRRITTGSGHHLLRGFENSSFGISTEKIMGFIIVDSQAEFLGYFGGSGPAGFAMKKHKNWTSIYCAVPVLPPTIVWNIIKNAKVHIYSESDDIIYANYSYVGIFTRTSGNRTINLPSMKKVRECFTDKIIADKSVSCFNLDVKQYHTYLFELL